MHAPLRDAASGAGGDDFDCASISLYFAAAPPFGATAAHATPTLDLLLMLEEFSPQISLLRSIYACLPITFGLFRARLPESTRLDDERLRRQRDASKISVSPY